jgi:DNA uptake protein ComE-like DNA-binding protein
VPASEKKARSPERWLVERAGGKREGRSPEGSEAVGGSDPVAGETLPSDEKKEEAQKPIGPEASKWLVAPAVDDEEVTTSGTEDDAKGAQAVIAEQSRRPTPAADLAAPAGNLREAEAARLAELVSSLQSELKSALARADQQASRAEAATNELRAARLSSQELEKTRKALEGQRAETAKLAKRAGVLKEEAEAATTRAQAQAARAEEALRTAERASTKEPKSKELQKALETLDAQRAENRELAKRISELQTDLRTQAKEAKAELKRALKERDRELKDALRQGEADAKERLAAIEMDWTKRLEGRESELQARIDDLEAKLAEAKKRGTSRARKTSTVARRKAPAKASSPKAPSPRPARSRKPATGRTSSKSRTRRRKAEKLDLNEATFEDLRELGLSVTQSARLIAYRDVREGYKSLDELDEIPGLSEETRTELRAQLKLSG